MCDPQVKFNRWVEHVEQALFALVEQGDDHQLFIGSYLQGHFFLQVANAELAGDFTPEGLDRRIQTSLAQAFAQNELQAEDQQQVSELWRSLYLQLDN